MVDEAKCIGCFACLTACPFNVPQFRDNGTMVKCDICLDRKEMGLEPACVRSCFLNRAEDEFTEAAVREILHECTTST